MLFATLTRSQPRGNRLLPQRLHAWGEAWTEAVEGEHLAKQLSAAERRLADAAARLRAALEAALAASTHESRHRTLLDQLVWEYCQAKRAVEGASLALEQWQQCQAAADAPAARESPAPPTPGLRFARWLYERGYIAG